MELIIMKKVLMIASAASHFSNFHIPYIKYLAEKGVQVYTASEGELSCGHISAHITLPFRKKLYHPLNLMVILRLARLMRKERFDAVYTNSSLAGFTGRMALILSGRKSTKAVHICHGYLFSDGAKGSGLYLFCEKLMRRRTDILAVMNREDAEIAEKYSLGKKIVFINGMGLDASRFPPISDDRVSAFRSELGATEKTLLFLCVGEFSPRKNQQCILRACSMIIGKDYRVVFAGEGELLESCKKLAEELRISDKMIFLGQFSDTNLLYRSCDCLISVSRSEGMPFNVMEAIYCGTDILVSKVKGNIDLYEAYGGRAFSNYGAHTLCSFISNTERQPHRKNTDVNFLLENVFEENLTKLGMN